MTTTLRVLGAEHPSTLTSIANLTLTLYNQGRWKEAEALEIRGYRRLMRAGSDGRRRIRTDKNRDTTMKLEQPFNVQMQRKKHENFFFFCYSDQMKPHKRPVSKLQHR